MTEHRCYLHWHEWLQSFITLRTLKWLTSCACSGLKRASVSEIQPLEAYSSWERSLVLASAVPGTVVPEPLFFVLFPSPPSHLAVLANQLHGLWLIMLTQHKESWRWGNNRLSEFFLSFKRLSCTQICSLTSLGVMRRNSPKYAILRLPNKLPPVSVLQDLQLLSPLPLLSSIFPLIISPLFPSLQPGA